MLNRFRNRSQWTLSTISLLLAAALSLKATGDLWTWKWTKTFFVCVLCTWLVIVCPLQTKLPQSLAPYVYSSVLDTFYVDGTAAAWERHSREAGQFGGTEEATGGTEGCQYQNAVTNEGWSYPIFHSLPLSLSPHFMYCYPHRLPMTLTSVILWRSDL